MKNEKFEIFLLSVRIEKKLKQIFLSQLEQ